MNKKEPAWAERRTCVQALMIKILNPIYDKWISQIDLKSRELIVGFIFVLLTAFFPLYHSSAFLYILYTQTQQHLAAGLMLLVAAVLSMNGRLEKIRWNMPLMVPFWLMGAGIVVSRLLHPLPSGYFVFGLMLLAVYPVLYFVWINRGDWERFFDIVALAQVISGLCFAAYTYVVMPILEEPVVSGRVQGTLSNSSKFSMLGMVLACCALYLLYRKWECKSARAFYSIAAAVGLVDLFLGMSRAAILGCGLGILGLIVFVYHSHPLSRKWMRRILCVGCVLLIVGILLLFVLQRSGDMPVGDGPTVTVFDRFSLEGRDLNRYSSGRIEIWAGYYNGLSMTGNDYRDFDFYFRAHNNFLELGYHCGIPVGIVEMLVELVALIISCVYAFSRKKHRDYRAFCILFMGVFFVESLFDVAAVPMIGVAPFFFYLMLAGMAGRRVNSHGSSGHYRSKH